MTSKTFTKLARTLLSTLLLTVPSTISNNNQFAALKVAEKKRSATFLYAPNQNRRSLHHRHVNLSSKKTVTTRENIYTELRTRRFSSSRRNCGKFSLPNFRATPFDEIYKSSTAKYRDSSSIRPSISRASAVLALIAVGYLMVASCDPALAITREYPSELTYGDTGVYNRRKMVEEKVKNARAQTISTSKEDPLKMRDKEDFLTTMVWSGALWLGLGSRSNFLVRPLANLLYESESSRDNDGSASDVSTTTVTSETGEMAQGAKYSTTEGSFTTAKVKSISDGATSTEQLVSKLDDEAAFVRDRNEGYFSDLPPGLTFILAAIFIASGWALNRFLTLFVLSGDSDLNLQLAGVTIIGGAFLELGRVASGEKQLTRKEADREMKLTEEFQQFASERILVQKGGNVHRSEVCASFRRYYAKYRNSGVSGVNTTGNIIRETRAASSPNDNVTDLEIERLMRSWNRQLGSGEDMSRAGFFNGVQLNKAADITTAEALATTGKNII